MLATVADQLSCGHFTLVRVNICNVVTGLLQFFAFWHTFFVVFATMAILSSIFDKEKGNRFFNYNGIYQLFSYFQ